MISPIVMFLEAFPQFKSIYVMKLENIYILQMNTHELLFFPTHIYPCCFNLRYFTNKVSKLFMGMCIGI